MLNSLHSIMLLAAAALITLLAVVVGGPAQAQSGIDPAFLAEVQGRWVSRFPHKDLEFEVVGTDIRLVVVDEKLGRSGTGSSQYIPRVGDLVAQITGATKRGTKQGVDGKEYPEYVFYVRAIANHGNGWRLAESSSPRYLTLNTQFCRDGLSGPTKPFYNFYTLSSPAVITDDGWRSDVKARIFRPRGSVANWADPVVPSCSQDRPSRTSRSETPSSTQGPALGTSEAPISIPVTSEQEQRELAEAERLNREQAEFSARQLAGNEQAVRDREALIARQKAEYDAQVAALEAERLRVEREHEAAMAKWRADAEACKKGDRTKCAQ